MINRNVVLNLENWASRKNRKPLVLRGARQVGKTTVVNQFAKNFEQYIYLNLETISDKKLFENYSDIKTLAQTIFLKKGKDYLKRKKTLLFIDEIQEIPEAFNYLRYFYEEIPELPVIVAGSLLETLLNREIKIPVGRVEYMVMRPVSFSEFLNASGESLALKEFNQIPLNNYAHDKLLTLFHTYAIIGGMPEIINQYLASQDLTSLKSIYESLITSYLEDVEKYAHSEKQTKVISHVIRSSFSEAGKRIKFQRFGKSEYGSRDISEAFQLLQRAYLMQLIYPSTGSKLPLQPDHHKSPRLQVLDTGLLNYMNGLQVDILGTDDLEKVYQGKVIEHLTGQELISNDFNPLSKLHFWTREKNTSMAELDYLIIHNSKVIPIEVKSGKEGKLKSLHLFMDESPSKIAVRIYSGKLSITDVTTMTGKKYKLLNLPYYLTSQLTHYIDWMDEEIRKSTKNKKKNKKIN
jgi:predicted AAA+ superfamily ATPase